ERELAAAGQPVEVINAGVEGYSVDHLLWRADEFAALEPEFVTVLIGWNGHLVPEPGQGGILGWAEEHLASVRAARVFPGLVKRVLGDSSANDFVSRERVPDPDDPMLEHLEKHYDPEPTDGVREFVRRMQDAG